jgi:hypothetical protein
MKTIIYLHICAINSWRKIVKRLFDRIKSSGLYDKIDGLYYSLLGDYECLNDDVLKDPKFHNVLYSPQQDLYESVTLNKLWYHATTEEFNVLYLHSKGVSYNETNQRVLDWVEYLTYYNIDRYSDCLKQLEDNDVVGVNISRNIMLHYSGNFWWSKSSYIKKSTQYCVHYTYNAPEYWITLSREGSYVDLNCLNDIFYNEIFSELDYKNKPFNTKKYKYTLEIS